MSYLTQAYFPASVRFEGVKVSSSPPPPSSTPTPCHCSHSTGFQLFDNKYHPAALSQSYPPDSLTSLQSSRQQTIQHQYPIHHSCSHRDQLLWRQQETEEEQDVPVEYTPQPIDNQWQSLPYSTTESCMQRQSYRSTPEGSTFTPIHSAQDRELSVPGQVWTAQYDWALPYSTVDGIISTPTHLLPTHSFPGVSHKRASSSSSAASEPSPPFDSYQKYTLPLYGPNGETVLNTRAGLGYEEKTFRFNPALLNGTTPRSHPFIGPTATHQAMTALAFDYHPSDEGLPDFGYSSRRSMSSMGNASPATPPPVDDGLEDTVAVNSTVNPASAYAGLRAHSNLQLFRTESQAFQDELYNPSQDQPTSTSTVKSAPTHLSPHQAIMSERLQAANNIRSQSPRSDMSRERSPFRDHSQYAPASDWRSPAGMTTAASIRKHMKEQAERAELAQHMPKLRREPTKTMSPKDAVLDVTDGDQPPLFQDIIPAGYKQHNTGGDNWMTALAEANPGSFRALQQMPPTTMGFRPDTTTVSMPADAYGFGGMLQSDAASNLPITALPAAAAAYNGMRSGQYLSPADAAPHFPPTLTSMESSISDNGPSSSADSAKQLIQRPADTRANTGTYTCTYHGCIERFDSHMNLQKHKRDVHRSQHHHALAEAQSSPQESSTGSSPDDATSAADESPRSSASPAPSGTGMTSAAIMARNSQAGPHKCTRINPSTGKPCNTIFSRPYDLTRHEDTIHNARKEKVRCPLCREEKTFSRNDALTRHMRVVHPEVESYGKRGRRD